MSKTDYYGTAPVEIGYFDLDFVEYMHYMYLPIWINDPEAFPSVQYSVPDQLDFAADLIEEAFEYEATLTNEWKYAYVTARRGYATPGNPLNRPGWHADGFGTEDINYVWTDKYPTDFAIGDFGTVSDDHVKSVEDFRNTIDRAATTHWEDADIHIVNYGDKVLLRLDDRVIHAAPEIPAPGGERSFFKVSFSNEKYNLKGNSHNYGMNYEWEMFDRDSVRNDPTKAGKDSA